MDQRPKYYKTILQIIKLLEESIEVNVHDLGFGIGFLYMTPIA